MDNRQQEYEKDMMRAANTVDMNHINKSLIKFNKLCEMNIPYTTAEELSGLFPDDQLNVIGLQTHHSWDTPLQSATIEGLHDFLSINGTSSNKIDKFEFECFTLDYADVKFVICRTIPNIYTVLFQRKNESEVDRIIYHEVF